MSENKPMLNLSMDQLEDISSAGALVFMGLEGVKRDTDLTEDEKVSMVFYARDLITAYLILYMGIDRDPAEAATTDLLLGAMEEGFLK